MDDYTHDKEEEDEKEEASAAASAPAEKKLVFYIPRTLRSVIDGKETN